MKYTVNIKTRKVRIRSVTIEGFRSIIQKMKYKLDRPGINLILGKNGFGKTTIFDALSWCIFGQLLKKNSSHVPWPKVTPDKFIGTKVRVKFDNGLEIIRCSDYRGKVCGLKGANKIFIIEDGKLNPIRDKRDTQRYIVQKLGYSFELFKNSVLFAQELDRLIKEDGPSKKKVFEEAFESTFILKAKEAVDNRVGVLIKEKDEWSAKLDKYMSLYTNNQNLLGDMKKMAAEFSRKKGLGISDLRRKIKGSKEKINKAKKILKKIKIKRQEKDKVEYLDCLEKVKAKVNKFIIDEEFRLEMDGIRYGTELQHMDREMKKLRGAKIKDNICSECGQKIKGEELIKHRQDIKFKTEQVSIRMKETESIIKATTKRQDELKADIRDQKLYKTQIKDFQDWIDIINNEIVQASEIKTEIALERVLIKEWVESIKKHQESKFEGNTSKIEANIEKFQAKVNKYKDRVLKVEKELEIQYWLLKDPLSNSGLKAYIFDSMLNRVNHFLKYYKAFIGFDVTVNMNLSSSNKDFQIFIEQRGDKVPYEDLSKGEKQLAEIALCFALNDVVTMNKPINILLMDEVFESLDKDNVEVVSNIINQKSLNRSIHLITHQGLFQPSNCYKTFITKNEQGQTIIDQKYRAA